MCGISGIISKNSQPNTSSILEKMCESQKHRGPEGCYYAELGDAKFAYNRLSYVNIMQNHQPYVYNLAGCMVVFNGEIYNYLQLSLELETISDKDKFLISEAEVIAHLYTRYGMDFVHKIEGMFAIAIYDYKNHITILIRDRFGQKPLFYLNHKNTIFFSSELQALCKYAIQNIEINENSISKYFIYNVIPAPDTLYKGIYKVRSGSMIIFNNYIKEEYEYWIPSFNKTNFFIKGAKLYNQLESVLKLAIKKRMSNEIKQGVLLSGGVDSSLISAMLLSCGYEHDTFNVKFENDTYDETKYALQVSDYLGTKHHVVNASNKDLASRTIEIMELLYDPIADPALICTQIICQYTRKYVKGVFTGDGADELGMGYRIFEAKNILDKLSFIIGKNNIKKILIFLSKLDNGNNKNLHFSLITSLLARGIGIDSKYAYYNITSAFNKIDFSNIFNIEMVCNDNDLYSEINKFCSQLTCKSTLEVMQMSMIVHYLRDVILTKLDYASMLASVEVRSPFLDSSFSELLLSLPLKYKIRGMTTKYAIKKIAEKYLPKNIIYRKKLGFRLPIDTLLRTFLREYMEDTLLSSWLNNLGLFKKDYISRLITEHLSVNKNNQKQLWSLMCLESSLRKMKF